MKTDVNKNKTPEHTRFENALIHQRALLALEIWMCFLFLYILVYIYYLFCTRPSKSAPLHFHTRIVQVCCSTRLRYLFKILVACRSSWASTNLCAAVYYGVDPKRE